MAIVAPAGVPTRVDAERAARALIAADVEEVLLYGSVARGTAGPHSDIDLVAIYADLDYADRAERARHLEALAREVMPWPVQVHATDRPEWQNRIERVSTSFEHRIAQDALPIATAATGRPVNWGKEMVLPMTNTHEALRYFNAWVLTHLQEMADHATLVRAGSDPDMASAHRRLAHLRRLAALCTAAALTAETSIKALAVLHGESPPTEQAMGNAGHSITKCLDLLPLAARQEAAEIFARLGDIGALSALRVGRTYPEDTEALHAAAERLAPTYAAMASEITALLAAHLQQALPLTPALNDAVAQRDGFAARIASVDLRTGTPSQTGSSTQQAPGARLGAWWGVSRCR